jgi:hypothetical protein
LETNILSIVTLLSKMSDLILIPNAISFAETRVSFLKGAEPLREKSVSVKVSDGK